MAELARSNSKGLGLSHDSNGPHGQISKVGNLSVRQNLALAGEQADVCYAV